MGFCIIYDDTSKQPMIEREDALLGKGDKAGTPRRF
jgi:hypothetical protein